MVLALQQRSLLLRDEVHVNSGTHWRPLLRMQPASVKTRKPFIKIIDFALCQTKLVVTIISVFAWGRLSWESATMAL